MNEEKQLIILAGNGPYANRGCEAIVRGTVKILRQCFRNPRFVCLSHFRSKDQHKLQRSEESDRAIIHLAAHRLDKKEIIQNLFKPETWDAIYKHFLNGDAFYTQAYRDILPYLDDTLAVLSIGGDNYSLDYGVPTPFTALDDFVFEHKRPIVLWGASVGPFGAMPDYERYMGGHLQKVTGIFARESATIEYLQSIGVSQNVYSVADPAFLMDAAQPNGEIVIDEGAIGLNLSPLMAKYITNGNIDQWTKIASDIIAEVARRTENQIYLIPHVMNPNSNDHIFMESALSQVPGKNKNIILMPPTFNAAETKWIISQMMIFAGARMHSTIAALSSCVPTLSLAYSIKAKGINRDIFGHLNYCINPEDLSSKMISDRIVSMLKKNGDIKMELKEKIPEIQRHALHAGSELKRLIEM